MRLLVKEFVHCSGFLASPVTFVVLLNSCDYKLCCHRKEKKNFERVVSDSRASCWIICHKIIPGRTIIQNWLYIYSWQCKRFGKNHSLLFKIEVKKWNL